MNQFRLSKTNAEIESSLVPALALGLALLGIASASILFVIAKQEIGPNATTCDRLGIAAIVFSIWNGVEISKHWSKEQFESQSTYLGVI